MPRERRGGSIPLSPTRPRRAAGAVRTARPGPPPYTSRRCRSPRPPAPSPPSSSRSRCPPSASTAPSDDAVRAPVAPDARPRLPAGQGARAPVLERHLGPGAVLEEAVEHLVQDAYRDALVEEDILPLTNADVDVVQAEEGKPLIFKATVQVRPEVELGDYRNFNFRPEIETIDDARVDQVIEELRDQNATLDRGRGSRRQGRRLRGHLVRRHAATASRSRAARPSGCR